jgi:hypothetical protein
MHACRNIHETRRVDLYIKGVSHGFVQMVYYCLDLFLISLQSCLLKFLHECKSGEIITGHINPEIVVRRALVLANSRDDAKIANILSHHVGPIPVFMFHEDGTMRKSCKSDLVKQFENDGQSLWDDALFQPT